MSYFTLFYFIERKVFIFKKYNFKFTVIMIIFFYLFALFSLTSCLLLNDCQKTPFWKLNLCEINCDKCGANGICENCPDGFNLTQSKCETDSELIYHNSYFTAA